jgi:hypothetical protein
MSQLRSWPDPVFPCYGLSIAASNFDEGCEGNTMITSFFQRSASAPAASSGLPSDAPQPQVAASESADTVKRDPAAPLLAASVQSGQEVAHAPAAKAGGGAGARGAPGKRATSVADIARLFKVAPEKLQALTELAADKAEPAEAGTHKEPGQSPLESSTGAPAASSDGTGTSCAKCGAVVPEWEAASHSDWHFAVELDAQDRGRAPAPAAKRPAAPVAQAQGKRGRTASTGPAGILAYFGSAASAGGRKQGEGV